VTTSVRPPWSSHSLILFGAVCGVLILDSLSPVWAQSVWGRIWNDLIERPSGPFAFRFLLQPTMAVIAGIVDGIKDAHTGRSPYFWTVLSDPEERWNRLREGLKATSRILLLGLAMDVAYQVIVLGTFYPFEAAIVAIALAFVPYLLIRGPAARIARHWQKHADHSSTSGERHGT
jgi:hypothetical protein